MKQQLHTLFLGILLIGSFLSFAQPKPITGIVTDSITQEPVSNVSILLKGTQQGTITDSKGAFKIGVNSLPAVLVFSSIGFETSEAEVTSIQPISVVLTKMSTLGQEIVVAATRVPTRILESPVSIERIGQLQIKNTPATSYYDMAGYLKGVDLNTSSLTFKTISTRGFNGSGSTRVNQLVDGMDNQAPGLNFFVGNFVGLTELDVDNMELLPGASSALYGPGGMNGTVLINSKNPFQYQGLSILLKEGVNNIDKSQRPNPTPFHDFSFRWAKAFNDKVAFKIGAEYIRATDWLAHDSSNYLRTGNNGYVVPGNRKTDPNYDGVNVYGDETSVDLRAFMAAVLPPGHILLKNPMPVSRTGYNESDVINPKTANIKLSGALHYKLTPKIEAQLMGYWATGNTIYTGSNRYVFKDIKLGQYKIEVRHPDWFLRSYTTQENAGQAYSATIATQVFNELWKPSFDQNNINGSWYPQYTGAFLTALQSGASMQDAHNMARAFADQGRPLPGSSTFNKLFTAARTMPIPNGGLFLEKSQLWMTEGQYSLSHLIKFADIIVGTNYKKYILNSKGTLFIDTAGPIHIYEAGAYGQITKKLLDNRLTLSFSGRYDKNQDFKGRFTPRVTALIKVAANSNLRVSYQTAYRFASTQQKYLRLDAGDYTLLGGLPWIVNYMQSNKFPVYELNNGVPSSTAYTYKELKPESVRSYEIGYKGLVTKKLLVDVYGYYGKYQNFLGRNALFQPASGKIYATTVNSDTKVNTWGYGIGLDYLLTGNYSMFFNMYSDDIGNVPTTLQTAFNTPKYRINSGIANAGLGKHKQWGFNIVWHWQDGFHSDNDLVVGYVDAYSTLDAQVSYKLLKVNSAIKIGGTNMLNHYYKNGFGNPSIGGLYYVSYSYNF